MKKLLLLICSATICGTSVFAADISPESKENLDAATVLYQKGITKVAPDKTAFYETLTRKNAALLIKRFAIDVLGKETISSEACAFSDLGNLNTNDRNEIVEACSLGLFKGKDGKFMPNDLLTRSQLVTVIGRLISHQPTMEKNDAYDLLLHLGLVKVDDRVNETAPALRKDIYIILQRVIVSISQLAVYQQFADGFTVGKTTEGTSPSMTKVVDADPYTEVLKIVAYQKDEIYDTFTAYQLGSAVVVEGGKIVTNAHVVLDEYGEEIGNYEICKTNKQNTAPVCYSVAHLMYYDVDLDLAVLEAEDVANLPKAVTFASKAPRNGEDVHVWGYPSIGGKSITYTKGIISGIENEKYKSDVKIDHGNSGGGAFNKQGELIGIPNSAMEDTDTLAYIIPYTAVQAFLKGEGDITNAEMTTDRTFESYITSVQEEFSAKSLDTEFFTLNSVGNMKVSSYVKDASRKLYDIVLSDTAGNTYLTLKTYANAGDQMSAQQEADELEIILDECYSTETATKTLGGKEWEYVSCTNPGGEKGSIHGFSYEEGDYELVAIISARGENTKNIDNALSVLEGITVKTFPKASFELRNIGPVALPATNGSNISYTIEACGCMNVTQEILTTQSKADLDIVFTAIEESDFEWSSEGESFFSYLHNENQFFTNEEYYNVSLSGTLVRTKMGTILYLLGNHDPEDNTRSIIAVTVVEYEGELYDITFYFTYSGDQDVGLERRILDYTDSIKINAEPVIDDLGTTPMNINAIQLQSVK